MGRNYVVFHLGRPINAIGKLVRYVGTVRADNRIDALNVHRDKLWDQGLETAGGEVIGPKRSEK